MTFYCYRCNKLIYNVSPEFHNNFCRNRNIYCCYNNFNSNGNKRKNHYINKHTEQVNYSTNRNNRYNYRNNNYRSGRRYNHRNSYSNINLITNGNNVKNRNLYSFNRYNVLNSLNYDDLFWEYLDLYVSNIANNSQKIVNSINFDLIESVIIGVNEQDNSEANNRPKGVKKSILNLLPTNKVNDISKLDEKKCIICLEYFVNGEVLTTIPCFHLFHPKCINEWFKNQNICPICKTKISDEVIS